MIFHVVMKRVEGDPEPRLFSSAIEAVEYFNTVEGAEEQGLTIVAVEV